jgi:hypothetical protein
MTFVPPVPERRGGRDLRNQQSSSVQWVASPSRNSGMRRQCGAAKLPA